MGLFVKNKGTLSCPNCKGHNIQLLSVDNNMNVKQKTTLNLNPLHPFTLTNTKEVKKKKVSGAKLGAAIMTCGMSTMVTGGIHDNKGNEYFCQSCGTRWIGK